MLRPIEPRGGGKDKTKAGAEAEPRGGSVIFDIAVHSIPRNVLAEIESSLCNALCSSSRVAYTFTILEGVERGS